MRYLKIYELFGSGPAVPFKWNVNSENYWMGTFEINGLSYSVKCAVEDGYYDEETNVDGHYWEMSFGVTDQSLNDDIIGTDGNEFKIFSVVIKALSEFIKEVKPEYIMISGNRAQPSKVRLYTTLAKYFDKDLSANGYEKCADPQNRYVDVKKRYFAFCWKRSN